MDIVNMEENASVTWPLEPFKQRVGAEEQSSWSIAEQHKLWCDFLVALLQLSRLCLCLLLVIMCCPFAHYSLLVLVLVLCDRTGIDTLPHQHMHVRPPSTVQLHVSLALAEASCAVQQQSPAQPPSL